MWEDYYKRLVKFYGKHQRYPRKKDAPRLYTWLGSQRFFKKKGELKKGRFQKLNQLPGVWDIKGMIWEQKYLQLKTLVDNKIHLSDHPDGNKLLAWLNNNRYPARFKRLTPSQRKRIDELVIQKKGYKRLKASLMNRWQQRLDELGAYLKKHGRYPGRKENNTISNWVEIQRIRGKQGILFKGYVEKLNAFGFIWYPEEARWNERFEELKTMMSGNRPPLLTDKTISLFAWICLQKRRCDNGKLAAERVEKLKSLGIQAKRSGRPLSRKLLQEAKNIQAQ